jgi:hypothetical protein
MWWLWSGPMSASGSVIDYCRAKSPTDGTTYCMSIDSVCRSSFGVQPSALPISLW